MSRRLAEDFADFALETAAPRRRIGNDIYPRIPTRKIGGEVPFMVKHRGSIAVTIFLILTLLFWFVLYKLIDFVFSFQKTTNLLTSLGIAFACSAALVGIFWWKTNKARALMNLTTKMTSR